MTTEAVITEGVKRKEYEIAFLVPQEELVPDILKILGQRGIEIKSEGTVKKIKLAYEINHAPEAFFVFFRVSGAPGDIKAVEADLTGNAQILRFLIILLPGTKAQRDEASQRTGRPLYRRPMGAPMGAVSQESRQPQVLSNEALEKKIEEILQ